MKKFESPQLNVVKFANNDVITTSGDGGYGGTETGTGVDSILNGFGVQPASTPGDEMPF